MAQSFWDIAECRTGQVWSPLPRFSMVCGAWSLCFCPSRDVGRIGDGASLWGKIWVAMEQGAA